MSPFGDLVKGGGGRAGYSLQWPFKEAPPKRGTFFRLQVYTCNGTCKRVGIDHCQYIKILTWLRGLGNKTKEITLRFRDE